MAVGTNLAAAVAAAKVEDTSPVVVVVGISLVVVGISLVVVGTKAAQAAGTGPTTLANPTLAVAVVGSGLKAMGVEIKIQAVLPPVVTLESPPQWARLARLACPNNPETIPLLQLHPKSCVMKTLKHHK